LLIFVFDRKSVFPKNKIPAKIAKNSAKSPYFALIKYESAFSFSPNREPALTKEKQ